MKMAEIRKMDESKLHKKLAELRSKLRELRFSNTVSHTRNPKEIREIKKDIARILTELNLRVKSKSNHE